MSHRFSRVSSSSSTTITSGLSAGAGWLIVGIESAASLRLLLAARQLLDRPQELIHVERLVADGIRPGFEGLLYLEFHFGRMSGDQHGAALRMVCAKQPQNLRTV